MTALSTIALPSVALHPADADTFGESRLDRALPWLSSCLMHAGIAIIAVFTFYMAVTPPKSDSPPIIIPFGDKVIIDHPGSDLPPGKDITRPVLQDILKNVPQPGVDANGTLTGAVGQVGGVGAKFLTDSMIGISTNGIGDGKPGPGFGEPGRIAPFGIPGGGNPNGILYAPPGAMRTVYILDHSGSMLDTFDFLRADVKRCVGELLAVQKFSIIMFSEDVQVLGPDQLIAASNENKREFLPKVDSIRAQGENDGLLVPFQRAFEKAFAMKPQLIVFLTDGQFDPKLSQVVKNLNKDGKVTISTIAFVHIEPDSAAQLKLIADQNGGRYKFVAEADLGR